MFMVTLLLLSCLGLDRLAHVEHRCDACRGLGRCQRVRLRGRWWYQCARCDASVPAPVLAPVRPPRRRPCLLSAAGLLAFLAGCLGGLPRPIQPPRVDWVDETTRDVAAIYPGLNMQRAHLLATDLGADQARQIPCLGVQAQVLAGSQGGSAPARSG